MALPPFASSSSLQMVTISLMRLQRWDYQHHRHRWHRWSPPNDGNDVMINESAVWFATLAFLYPKPLSTANSGIVSLVSLALCALLPNACLLHWWQSSSAASASASSGAATSRTHLCYFSRMRCSVFLGSIATTRLPNSIPLSTPKSNSKSQSYFVAIACRLLSLHWLSLWVEALHTNLLTYLIPHSNIISVFSTFFALCNILLLTFPPDDRRSVNCVNCKSKTILCVYLEKASSWAEFLMKICCPSSMASLRLIFSFG